MVIREGELGKKEGYIYSVGKWGFRIGMDGGRGGGAM